MNQMDGVIDLKDLFAEIVRKSIWIVVCTLMFAGALGGYKYINDKKSSEDIKTTESTVLKEELEGAQKYVDTMLEYANLDEYMKTSIRMSCNPYNIYQTEVKYVISGNAAEDDISTIRTCYEDYILYGQLTSDVISKDKDYDGKVLIDAFATDKKVGIKNNDTTKIVQVLIYAKNEKQAKELSSYVKTSIEDYSNSVAELLGNHELVYMNEVTTQVVDYELILEKKELETNFLLLEAEVQSLGGQLSTAQRNYAADVLKDSLDEKALEELKIEKSVGSSNAKGVIKFAVLGAAAGFSLSIVLIIALYFFSNQIKSEKEVEHLMAINHFGNCPIYKSGKLDKLADKLFFKDKSYDISASKEKIVEEIIRYCKNEKIDRISFIGQVDEITATALKDVKDDLESQSINTAYVESVSSENRDLSNHVIHVEVLKKTNMQELHDTVKFCETHNIKLGGYITFSK